jgi:hypothetical protein
MTANEDPATASWESHFGAAATVQLPAIGLDLAIIVPERYYYSVVRSAVEKAKGAFTAQASREFLDEAAKKWYERHRNDKTLVTKQALEQVGALVPSSEPGLPFRRLQATLAGACRDDALARLLLRRYGSSCPRTKALALREAFLEAANDALGTA